MAAVSSRKATPDRGHRPDDRGQDEEAGRVVPERGDAEEQVSGPVEQLGSGKPGDGLLCQHEVGHEVPAGELCGRQDGVDVVVEPDCDGDTGKADECCQVPAVIGHEHHWSIVPVP